MINLGLLNFKLVDQFINHLDMHLDFKLFINQLNQPRHFLIEFQRYKTLIIKYLFHIVGCPSFSIQFNFMSYCLKQE